MLKIYNNEAFRMGDQLNIYNNKAVKDSNNARQL